MGRIAGVTSADTRARLVQAAAESFESSGYDGTRVADIAGAAGVSNGALYGHFESKSELLAEALRDHASAEIASLFLDDPDRHMLDLLVEIGKGLVDRSDPRGALVIEALVAARRDPDVAELMRGHLSDRTRRLSDLVSAGQGDGAFDPRLDPEAIGRFFLMLALGSLVLPAAGLDPVDPAGWSALVERLVDGLRPPDHQHSPLRRTT